MKIQLSDGAKEIISQLNKNGFEAFAVGGCVRDSVLGFVPNDWDICTEAKPLQIKKCFDNYQTFDSGIKHGTISVVINKDIYEVTTYRIDGEYTDNRHPETVEFTDVITKDLARRDFTANAMAYNDDKGIIDPFGGISDLSKKTLRCVGDADIRFNEDALRILRALRFSSTYDFDIDEQTSVAIKRNLMLLKNISVERIAAELNKLLCGDYAEKILNEYRDVFAVFIPEIKSMFDNDQNNIHHSRDLWHHTTYSVKSVKNELLLRMTMLLHDIGKPSVKTVDENGICHFKGHQDVSVDIADKILHRLKYSSDFIKTCLTLIKYHDIRFNGNKKLLKRVMSKIGEDNTRLLFDVQYADTMAQSKYQREQKLEYISIAQYQFDEIIKENECFKLSQLAVNGNDLKSIGIKEGRQIGLILNHLMEKVILDELKNQKDVLLSYIENKKDFS